MSDPVDQIKKELTKKLTGKQSTALLVVGAFGLWLVGLCGIGPFAVDKPTNAPLSAAQVVERMKSVDGVVDAAAPVPGESNIYQVTVLSDSLRGGADIGMKALHEIALHSHDVDYLMVIVTIRLTLVDDYGKTTNRDVFSVRVKKSDIEQFNYDNADGSNLLRVGLLWPTGESAALAIRILTQECRMPNQNGLPDERCDSVLKSWAIEQQKATSTMTIL